MIYIYLFSFLQAYQEMIDTYTSKAAKILYLYAKIRKHLYIVQVLYDNTYVMRFHCR